jgi:trehalose 6-phosphate phosphatase
LPGKFMIEVKQVGFNKATGVRELMKFAPFTGRRPIVLGDDITDESMFRVAPEYDGVAISVGARLAGVSYHFDKPTTVRHWLTELSNLEEITGDANWRPVHEPECVPS